MRASNVGVPKWYEGWFSFTTRDLTVMAVLVAVTGVFQYGWSHFVFGVGVLGPFANLFASYGFNIASFVILYFVPKPGASTVTKFFGAIVEVLLGNPFGPIAIFYGTVEGFAADLGFVMFKRKLSLLMIIIASLMAWIFAAPVDAYRDHVQMNLDAVLAYFGPGGMGKVWVSFLVYATLVGLKRVGINPPPETELVEQEQLL